MNNIRPFASEYIEITIPLSDEGIALLEERNPEALHDYYFGAENANAVCVECEMKVIFAIEINETFFMLNVNTYYDDEDALMDGSGIYLDLDCETAEYFKAEALTKLMCSTGVMAKCRCNSTIATA